MQMIYLYIDSHKEALRSHVINIHRELDALHIYRVVLQISSRVLTSSRFKVIIWSHSVKKKCHAREITDLRYSQVQHYGIHAQ